MLLGNLTFKIISLVANIVNPAKLRLMDDLIQSHLLNLQFQY